MHLEHPDGTVPAEGRRIWRLSTPHLSLFYASGVLLGFWIALQLTGGWDLLSMQGLVSVLGIATAVCLGIVPISLARHRKMAGEVNPPAGRNSSVR
jgi:hypothetical protein